MKKIALIFALGFSVNTAFANDLRDTSLYTPGGKYRMFGSGRGTVEKVKNNIRRTSTTSYDNGPTHVDIHHYSGQLTYEQSFSNHPLSEHGSFSNSSAMRVIDSYGTITAGKITATNARIKGREVHPDDAYDAADGGDHPYDAYSYHVDGEVRTTSIRPVGLPKQTVPTMTRYDDNGNAVTGNNDNQLPEKGSADANNMNDRTRDLVGAGNPNLPNGSSDVANGEVPLPKDLSKDKSSWIPNISLDLTANAAFAPGIGPNSEFGVNLVQYNDDGLEFANGGYIKSGLVTGGGKVEASANLQLTIGGSSDGMNFAKCGSIKLGRKGGAGGCMGFSGDTQRPYFSVHAGYGAGGGYWTEYGISKSWTWEDVTKQLPSPNK